MLMGLVDSGLHGRNGWRLLRQIRAYMGIQFGAHGRPASVLRCEWSAANIRCKVAAWIRIWRIPRSSHRIIRGSFWGPLFPRTTIGDSAGARCAADALLMEFSVCQRFCTTTLAGGAVQHPRIRFVVFASAPRESDALAFPWCHVVVSSRSSYTRFCCRPPFCLVALLDPELGMPKIFDGTF